MMRLLEAGIRAPAVLTACRTYLLNEFIHGPTRSATSRESKQAGGSPLICEACRTMNLVNRCGVVMLELCAGLESCRNNGGIII